MRKNLIGEIFIGVEVVGDVGRRNSRGEILWLCRCLSCGETKTLAWKYDLERGDYQSCGCLRIKITTEKKTTHGKSFSTEYNIWSGMKDRCYNSNLKEYPRYGGRGITVCDRWLNSFENFLEDMGHRPGSEYSIDRIDNNRGYCKDNCRWATRSEQAYNREKIQGTTSKHKNIYFNKKAKKWMARLWIDKKRIHLGSFNTEDEAVKAIKEYTNGA